MRLPFISAIVVCLGFATAGSSQQMRIIVLEAHHGKPVPGECLNISLGPWHGTDIYVSTNENGIAALNFDFNANQVSAEPVPSQTCKGFATPKPVQLANSTTSISVVPDWYVSCQYSKELVKSQASQQMSPSQRITSFAVQDILSKGAVALNSCSKLVLSPKPGELMLIVRKRTFWEGMKS